MSSIQTYHGSDTSRETQWENTGRERCDYSASQVSHLRNHIIKRTGEKPFQCDQCDYSSSQKAYLTKHRILHTGEKPFQCDQSDYSASQKSNLTMHRRRHTGEKPFQCDYTTSWKSAIKCHTLQHTAGTSHFSS